MANQISTVVTYRDAVTGRTVGGIHASASTFREVISGDRLGRLAPGVYNSIITDAVTGFAIGAWVKDDVVTREVLSGESIGLDLMPQFGVVYREIIGRDSSFKFTNDVREIIGSAPDEFVSVARMVPQMRQLVGQVVSRQATPTVWSMTTVPVYRMLVAQRGHVLRPISEESVKTARQLIGVQAARPAPPNVFSILRMPTLRQQVAVSRLIPYTPVSGNFTYTMREQVAMHKVVKAVNDPTIRSSESAITVRELVALSKRVGYQLRALQVFELVARQRIVTFSAPTTVYTDVQEVAQRRAFPAAQRSPLYAVTDMQQVAQHRVSAGIVRSFTTVVTYSGMVAQRRPALANHSTTTVAGDLQQIAQHRDAADPGEAFGSDIVAVLKHQTAQHRVPSPLPYTGESVKTVSLLAAQHRETAPPNATSDWRVMVNQTLVAQMRAASVVRSTTTVKTQRVQYALGADYPPPDEVMGPETGAQVKQHWQQSAQFRVTESPHAVVLLSRFVYSLGQRPVVTDTFPDKNDGYTHAQVSSLTQQVVTTDTMPDPALAFSDVTASSVTSPVVLQDEPWPDPALAFSEAVVTALHETVVLGDTLDDPTLPISEVRAYTVGQFAVVGDDSLPDPVQPTSRLEVRLVGAVPVLGDDSFADPTTGASPVDTFALGMTVVLRDISMLSIPKRADRRRAVITVSIS